MTALCDGSATSVEAAVEAACAKHSLDVWESKDAAAVAGSATAPAAAAAAAPAAADTDQQPGKGQAAHTPQQQQQETFSRRIIETDEVEGSSLEILSGEEDDRTNHDSTASTQKVFIAGTRAPSVCQCLMPASRSVLCDDPLAMSNHQRLPWSYPTLLMCEWGLLLQATNSAMLPAAAAAMAPHKQKKTQETGARDKP
jgi:hypothetical protein